MPENFTWGPAAKKIAVPTYVVTTISFFKESLTASKNPSSMFLGIHLYRPLRHYEKVMAGTQRTGTILLLH